MKKLIVASLTSILIFASMNHTAIAAERVSKRHHGVTNEHVRGARASIVPFEAPADKGAAHYYDGALGAGIAGH